MTVEWKVSTAASIATLGAQAVVGGTPVGTELVNTAEPTTDTSQSFAIPGLTRAQLLNGAFGVRVRATRGNNNTAFTASLDAVSVTVDYTAASVTSITVNAVGATTARGADSFTYDQANHLTSATVAGVTETYAYDGDGVRFSRQVGAGPVTRYVSDVNTSLPVTLDDGVRTYVWGIGLAYAVSGTALEVYHTDRLGSVRAISDAAGAVTATYRTDEFGIPTATTGTSSQPFAFTGEPRDATGLSYLRARYYDPSLGRFMSRDPWPGRGDSPASLNRYAYVGNNPATYSDPSGKAGPVAAACVFVPAACVKVSAAVIEFLLFVAAAAGGAVLGYLAFDLRRVDAPGVPPPLPPPTGTLLEPRPPPAPLRFPEGPRCPPGAFCRMVVVFGAGGLVTIYYVNEAMKGTGQPRPEPGPTPDPVPSPKSRVLR